MKYRLISQSQSHRLILIFAGWGMDDKVFADLSRPGYDVMVVWDYSSFYINWEILHHYNEICILAWSMGVFAAAQTTHAIGHKVTRRIAVNGTPKPVDDRYGIPEAIFNGTLHGLNENSLRKFYRRMCATPQAFAQFTERAPKRDIDTLRAELQSILDRTFFGLGDSMEWDLAIIGRDDRIFPHHNQRRAWADLGVPCIETDDGHYIDFNKILDRFFVDKSLARARFSSAVSTYESQAAVQADAIDRLMDACKSLGISAALTAAPDAVLEIGSGSGMLTRRLARLIGNASFHIWDLAAPVPANLPERLNIMFQNCDAEMKIMQTSPRRYNMIFTASTVQWFNSPALFLKNCHRALTDGGILALTTYTEGNMHEISDITGITLPLLKPSRWQEMAEGMFDVLYSLSYERDLDFESPLEVLRHMKVTGVNSLSRSGRGAVSASEVIRRYPMRLDGRYHLTYKPFIMILRKK